MWSPELESPSQEAALGWPGILAFRVSSVRLRPPPRLLKDESGWDWPPPCGWSRTVPVAYRWRADAIPSAHRVKHSSLAQDSPSPQAQTRQRKAWGGGLTEWPVAVLGSELPLRDSSLNRRMPNVVVAVTGHSNPCMTAQLQVLVSQRGRKLQRKAGCLRKPTALQGMLFPGLNIAWVQSRPAGQP